MKLVDGGTRIIWREWYNESAVSDMTRMGTLPLEEIILDVRGMDGEDVAAEIAKTECANGSEMFRESADIVIIEPEDLAGQYHICVDYEPTFSAYRDD